MTLWTDLLGAEIRRITADGVPTRVISLGSGDPVVLLHGRGGHTETFARTLPALAGAGYEAVAVDLLGHGLTERVPGGYGVERLTAHVTAVLDALGLGQVALVGQSLGGWVATLLALRSPARVRRLALIEPAGLQSEEERLADDRVRAAYERGGQAYDAPTREAVRARLAGLLSDPEQVDPELVAVRTRLYGPAEARQVHRLVRAADNRDLLLTPEVLAGLTVPTLLIRGADGHTPLTVVQTAATAIPDARLITIADAKQWPQYEQPIHVGDALIRFFTRKETSL